MASFASAETASKPDSAPTPAIYSSDGAVSFLDATSKTPWLKIKDTAGKEWAILIDPKATALWKGGRKGAWTDLKVGDKVSVRHMRKEGKEVAKTVEII